MAEKELLLSPGGLPGIAGRGPACPVVWEPGGEIPPADPIRLRHIPSVLAGKVAPLALGRAQYAASSHL